MALRDQQLAEVMGRYSKHAKHNQASHGHRGKGGRTEGPAHVPLNDKLMGLGKNKDIMVQGHYVKRRNDREFDVETDIGKKIGYIATAGGGGKWFAIKGKGKPVIAASADNALSHVIGKR